MSDVICDVRPGKLNFGVSPK